MTYGTPTHPVSYTHLDVYKRQVEYEEHTSPSVYVAYRLTSDPETISPALAGREVFTIIWTTTPWTLPASLSLIHI